MLVLPAAALQVADHSFQSKCSELLQPLWQTAASLLNSTTVADCFWLEDFYSKNFATVETWAFPSATLSYIPEWKVANNAIRCNLDKARETVQAASHGNSHSFTMVREPLERFVSGFSEINAHDIREFCSYDRPSSYRSEDMQSPKRAQYFLQDLISGSLTRQCWIYWHVFSMLGPLRYLRYPSQKPYIGKLEQFDDEWKLLSEKAGTRFPPFDYECGAHQTSSNENFPPRSNMQKMVSLYVGDRKGRAADMLFYMDKSVRTALVCSVLLPDYVCFGYDFPDGADTCVRARFAKSMSAWDRKVSHLKQMFCPHMES